MVLFATLIPTPVGSMIALANEHTLYFLDFIDHPKLTFRLTNLQKTTNSTFLEGTPDPLLSITQELDAYFTQGLSTFTTPLKLLGSTFQKAVWQELLSIPYGATISYTSLAYALSKPTAVRAVANANGANRFAVIIPCHRVIASGGELGGYGSGVARKKLLITHEQKTQFL